jgi:hypothetical protein
MEGSETVNPMTPTDDGDTYPYTIPGHPGPEYRHGRNNLEDSDNAHSMGVGDAHSMDLAPQPGGEEYRPALIEFEDSGISEFVMFDRTVVHEETSAGYQVLRDMETREVIGFSWPTKHPPAMPPYGVDPDTRKVGPSPQGDAGETPQQKYNRMQREGTLTSDNCPLCALDDPSPDLVEVKERLRKIAHVHTEVDVEHLLEALRVIEQMEGDLWNTRFRLDKHWNYEALEAQARCERLRAALEKIATHETEWSWRCKEIARTALGRDGE